MSLFDELRRRNVFRIATGYVVTAWLIIQVTETVFPVFGFSDSAIRNVIIILAIGFIPAVATAWVMQITPNGLRIDHGLDESTEINPQTRRNFDRAVIAILVIGVSYFAFDKFVFDPVRDEAEIAAATEQATKRALSGAFLDQFRDRSILVVPFLNLSSDPEQEFFADGMSEELLNQLARIEELRVISRSTSWTFKGKDVNVAEVRRKLDVSHILEGSVRKAGNDVRITAQLIDARTDTHLWSETYDKPLDDIFAIQDGISVAVADRLHLEIFNSRSPHDGIDQRAYELFLRASVNPANAEMRARDADDMLKKALAIEPDYLPALYALAVAIEQAPDYNTADKVREKRQAVTTIVDRIIELAPDSIYANNWQAYMAMRWHNDLITAAPHLEKGMQFANRTDVHIWFNGAMDLLHKLGRYDEAVTVGQYWINRDPYCGYCLGRVARAMTAAGRHEEAALIVESQLARRKAAGTMFWHIGVMFLAANNPRKALHYFDQIPDNDPSIDKRYARAFALYSLGQIDEFESLLEERLMSYTDGSAEGIARLYAWSNQRDKAFEWLESMIAERGEKSAMGVKTELYEPIKSDPRWQAFLEKYGAEDKGHLNVKFEPRYPPTLQRAVDALKMR